MAGVDFSVVVARFPPACLEAVAELQATAFGELPSGNQLEVPAGQRRPAVAGFYLDPWRASADGEVGVYLVIKFLLDELGGDVGGIAGVSKLCPDVGGKAITLVFASGASG